LLDAHAVRGFTQSLLQRKFDQPVPTPQLHMEMWELCCSEARQVAIAAPRSHAKSTAVSFSFVLAAVLFRQHKFVIICSGTESQSTLFLGDIKQELIENEDLIKLFGVKKFVKLSETDIIVEMEDGHRFRILAKGAEQQLRGVKWAGTRPDLIIGDDLESDEAVMNQDRREKFRRWFYGALLPARASGGKVIIVGTILHMDSLLERLMSPPLGFKLEYNGLRSYPVSATNKKPYWKSIKYKAHNEDFSQLLWEEKFSKEELQNLRQSFHDQGLSDVYSREYLNYPIDENTAYFRRDDFLPLAPEDADKNLAYYAAADFAVSTNERSDYTVISVVGVDSNGAILVKDIRRGRWDASEIINEMFTVQRRYKPELFTVEKGTIEKALGPFLKKEMLQRNVYINLNPLTPTKDKMSRARSIQARMRSGGIRFDKDASWYPTLEDEMVRFPKDRHDDQVDSLAWVGLTIDQIIEAPTQKELEDEEWEEQFGSTQEYKGRSAVTGY
jgi:predicted phage terminase large subunit-like protein